MIKCKILLLLLFLFGGSTITAKEATLMDYRIGAFNIQTLGESKMQKEFVKDVIKNVVHRYSIIFIQEIRDVRGGVVKGLLQLANSDGYKYKVAASAPLGRTNNKETYAYFYRQDQIELIDTYQVAKKLGEKFERPPFCFHFRILGSKEEFAIIGGHLKPEDAVLEMNALKEVYSLIKKTWTVANIFLMGDFNADCDYVSKNNWNMKKTKGNQIAVELYHDENLYWGIHTRLDTTSGSSKACAYDRIIVENKAMKFVKTESIGPFYYACHQKPYANKNLIRGKTKAVWKSTCASVLQHEQVTSVSDHFPVEFVLSLDSSPSSKAHKLKNPFLTLKTWFKSLKAKLKINKSR